MSAAGSGGASVETIGARAAGPLEIYTVDFTQTPAENFFGRVKRAGTRRLLDAGISSLDGATAEAASLEQGRDPRHVEP